MPSRTCIVDIEQVRDCIRLKYPLLAMTLLLLLLDHGWKFTLEIERISKQRDRIIGILPLCSSRIIRIF